MSKRKVQAKVKEVNAPKTEQKELRAVVNTMIYPNKGKFEIDQVKVSLDGKDESLVALKEANLDITKLKLDDLLKSLFTNLMQADVGRFQFGYKNVYGFGFGLVPKGFNSYKSVITHHNNDGLRSLIVNSNKHFGMDNIKASFESLGVIWENHKTYAKLYISKENLDKVTKACQQLVGIKLAD